MGAAARTVVSACCGRPAAGPGPCLAAGAVFGLTEGEPLALVVDSCPARPCPWACDWAGPPCPFEWPFRASVLRARWGAGPAGPSSATGARGPAEVLILWCETCAWLHGIPPQVAVAPQLGEAAPHAAATQPLTLGIVRCKVCLWNLHQQASSFFL